MLAVIILLCFVLPFVVIIHDRMVHYRWYTKKPKMVFLRLNTEKVRDLLKKEDFELCWCCTMKGNIYLTANNDGSIHGLGTPYEDNAHLSAKEVLALHIYEAQQLNYLIIDCGTDVKLFIREAKLLKKNRLCLVWQTN